MGNIFLFFPSDQSDHVPKWLLLRKHNQHYFHNKQLSEIRWENNPKQHAKWPMHTLWRVHRSLYDVQTTNFFNKLLSSIQRKENLKTRHICQFKCNQCKEEEKVLQMICISMTGSYKMGEVFYVICCRLLDRQTTFIDWSLSREHEITFFLQQQYNSWNQQSKQ